MCACSCSGEQHPEGKNPYNTMVMITDAGEVNLVYRYVAADSGMGGPVCLT
jgi:hypothetical protein